MMVIAITENKLALQQTVTTVVPNHLRRMDGPSSVTRDPSSFPS
jgi:hypothetical protein